LSNRRVLASGVFDVLHLEHVRYLEEAKKAGGPRAKLIVVLARDEMAARMRGTAPIFSERARLRMVRALKVVDDAMLGPSSDNLDEGIRKTLLKVRPDIIAFGYDQQRSSVVSKVKSAMRKLGLRSIRLVRIRKFVYDDLSRSSLVKTLIAGRFSRRGRKRSARPRP